MQKLIRKKISHNDLKTILTEICQLTNFDYGEIWLPNDKSDFLELSSNYYVMPGNHQYDLELFHTNVVKDSLCLKVKDYLGAFF